MGRLEEAEDARREALTTWESASTPVTAVFPHGKGLAHYRLGELLHRTGREEEAASQFADAQAIMEDLARCRPDESICHWQLGQKEEALKRYTEAQKAIEANKPIFYEYIGVMAVDRLWSEAQMLLEERTGGTP